MYHIATLLCLAKGAGVSMLASDDAINHIIVALRHGVVKDHPHRLELPPKWRGSRGGNILMSLTSFTHKKLGRKGAHLTYITKPELGDDFLKKRYVLRSPTVGLVH